MLVLLSVSGFSLEYISVISRPTKIDARLTNMLVLLLVSRIVLEYIKAISRPTTIDVELQNILMVSVKIMAIFFNFFSVQIIEQVYGNATDNEEILWHKENIGKASCLLRLMA